MGNIEFFWASNREHAYISPLNKLVGQIIGTTASGSHPHSKLSWNVSSQFIVIYLLFFYIANTISFAFLSFLCLTKNDLTHDYIYSWCMATERFVNYSKTLNYLVSFHSPLFFSFQVDGHFSPWSDWSECSKTCGSDSYRKRERTCTDPPPRYGGEECEGRSVERRHCLKPPCPPDLGAYNMSKVFLQNLKFKNGEISIYTVHNWIEFLSLAKLVSKFI